jgi:hypothetical protein
MGIHAKIEKKYQKGAFVVIKLQIVEVDKLSLFRTAKGNDFAATFEVLVDSITKLGLADTVLSKIDEKVLFKVNEALKEKISVMIPAKLKENGVQVDCVVCSSEDQADFFFDEIQHFL